MDKENTEKRKNMIKDEDETNIKNKGIDICEYKEDKEFKSIQYKTGNNTKPCEIIESTVVKTIKTGKKAYNKPKETITGSSQKEVSDNKCVVQYGNKNKSCINKDEAVKHSSMCFIETNMIDKEDKKSARDLFFQFLEIENDKNNEIYEPVKDTKRNDTQSVSEPKNSGNNITQIRQSKNIREEINNKKRKISLLTDNEMTKKILKDPFCMKTSYKQTKVKVVTKENMPNKEDEAVYKRLYKNIHSKDPITLFSIYNDLKKITITDNIFNIIFNKAKEVLFRDLHCINPSGDLFYVGDDISVKNKVKDNINIFLKFINLMTCKKRDIHISENDIFQLMNLLKSEDENERVQVMGIILNILEYNMELIKQRIVNEMSMYFENLRTHIGIEEMLEIIEAMIIIENASIENKRYKSKQYSKDSPDYITEENSLSILEYKSNSIIEDNQLISRSVHTKKGKTNYSTTDTNLTYKDVNKLQNSKSIAQENIVSYINRSSESNMLRTEIEPFYLEIILRFLKQKHLNYYKIVPRIIALYCKRDVDISMFTMKYIYNLFDILDYTNRPILIEAFFSVYIYWHEFIPFEEIRFIFCNILNKALSSSHYLTIEEALQTIENKTFTMIFKENIYEILPSIFDNLYLLSKKYWRDKGRLKVYKYIEKILSMSHDCFEKCLIKYNKKKYTERMEKRK